MGIVVTILILSLLVIVHEFGHFIVAKLSGIKVLEFSIFMGPKLISIQPKETKYTLRLIPIGGYVSMEGEDESSDDKRAFNNKPWYIRALVIIAGPFMNIVLAIIVTCMLFSMTGYTTMNIGEVIPDSLASEQGIEVGDRIVEVNGMSVHSTVEVELYKQMAGELRDDGKVYNTFVIKRGNGEKVSITTNDKVGVVYETFMKGEGGFISLLKGSIDFSYSMIKVTLKSLWWLITGKVPVTDMAGPIGVTQLVNDTIEQSPDNYTTFLNMLILLITISVNLGVVNLAPFPALDGGKLVLILIEAVRRKRIPPEKEAAINGVGFMLLMILAIVVAIGDITRLFK